MLVVTGVTGQVGRVVAETLIADGHLIRVVVRSADKGEPWADRGCEVAVVADITDTSALTAAFQDAQGVFIMLPPDYDPEPGFPETRRAAESVCQAIERARPARVVFLSTVGAHVTKPSLLNNAAIFEARLRQTGVPVAMLRPAWFMENAKWDLPAAKAGGFRTFLSPVDHPIDMVSVRDIGREAADLVKSRWTGQRIVELRGPARYSAMHQAAGFAAALGRPVGVEVPARDLWEQMFRQEGMAHPEPRMQMLDGFNEDWIVFEEGDAEQRIGAVTLDEVLKDLVEGAAS